MTIQVYVYPHYGSDGDPRTWSALAMVDRNQAFEVVTRELSEGDDPREVFALDGQCRADYQAKLPADYGNVELIVLEAATDLPGAAMFAYVRSQRGNR